MKREQLEHLIRAAGAITGSPRLIVIGSQSILGSFPDTAPPRALLSREADLFPLDAPEKSDIISVVLGELSPFDQTFGYYADGVEETTARLPEGWRERLIPIDNPNTSGYIGLCLEVHDLLIAKYFAGRDKDREFCAAVAAAGLVSRAILIDRLQAIEIDAVAHARMSRAIDADLPR